MNHEQWSAFKQQDNTNLGHQENLLVVILFSIAVWFFDLCTQQRCSLESSKPFRF